MFAIPLIGPVLKFAWFSGLIVPFLGYALAEGFSSAETPYPAAILRDIVQIGSLVGGVFLFRFNWKKWKRKKKAAAETAQNGQW